MVHSKNDLQTEITVDGQIYYFINFPNEEESVTKEVMDERIKEMDNNLGIEDFEHIWRHQDEIPANLRDKVRLIFLNDRHPYRSYYAACLHWDGDQWKHDWESLDTNDYWSGYGRILCRKK